MYIIIIITYFCLWFQTYGLDNFENTSPWTLFD